MTIRGWYGHHRTVRRLRKPIRKPILKIMYFNHTRSTETTTHIMYIMIMGHIINISPASALSKAAIVYPA